MIVERRRPTKNRGVTVSFQVYRCEGGERIYVGVRKTRSEAEALESTIPKAKREYQITREAHPSKILPHEIMDTGSYLTTAWR